MERHPPVHSSSGPSGNRTVINSRLSPNERGANAVRLILENSPPLNERQKLEIVNLGWLFTHAPGPDQANAMQRIYPLLGSDHIDATAYMHAVRDVAESLNRAIDERLGEKQTPRRSAVRR
jgi:hypothetical protein